MKCNSQNSLNNVRKTILGLFQAHNITWANQNIAHGPRELTTFKIVQNYIQCNPGH